MLLNTATMEFFLSTFFSLFPERLDAAHGFGSLAFFMRTKARRDRVNICVDPRDSREVILSILYRRNSIYIIPSYSGFQPG